MSKLRFVVSPSLHNVDIDLNLDRKRLELRAVVFKIVDKVWDKVRDEVTSEIRVSFSIRSIISLPRAGSSCSVGSTPASRSSERGKANLVANLVPNLVVLRSGTKGAFASPA